MTGLNADREPSVPVVNAVTGDVGEVVVDPNSGVNAVVVGQGDHVCFRPSVIDPGEMIPIITPSEGLQTD